MSDEKNAPWEAFCIGAKDSPDVWAVRDSRGVWVCGGVTAAQARCIAAAPQLAAMLKECADRFERCCIHGGSDKEFAAHAVADYRAGLAAAGVA